MLDAKVLALSDRGGTLYFKDGLTKDQLAEIIDLKTFKGGTLESLGKNKGVEYLAGKRPWQVPCQAAFPCATQNELDEDDAATLLKNGCYVIAEGANMPSTTSAVHMFEKAQILYGPGKAANAGGVAISGLEMTQNAIHLSWTRDDVDQRLQQIMHDIHEQCVQYGRNDEFINYVAGANIGGFVKVADATVAYGIVWYGSGRRRWRRKCLRVRGLWQGRTGRVVVVG
jgi:glutamate dehydrogenase/leucine dehydrogenase